MKECRGCGQTVSEQARFCPGCGAPRPALETWDGYGYEYKSQTQLWGWPVLHISFKYRPNKIPVVARGIIAIGQFGVGLITIAQFGIGVIAVGQFALGAWVLAQIGVGWFLIAQVGLFAHKGLGQAVENILDLIGF